MNPNICNNCGANYIYQHGRWICQACGSYKPEELSNEEVTLLYTAYQKLRLAEFSEAEMEFDDILHKYPENPNAYWGRLMSKYGIKYEQDFDGRMIPTCYATSIESILSSTDYQKALQYADEENKAYYKEQAEYIERVRKEWIEKAKKEKPYDIFICYKDSDLANGIKRTTDSIAAQDLYIHLTNLGYRVFYSHESLRDKAGEKYEPHIFNALSTAKVMIVYGSKAEYITSTWLKNEWTRYEKRIKSGEKKPNSLLIAYDGFAPSELPNMLSSMQCFDASEKSFYSDLDKTIYQIIHGKETPITYSNVPKKKNKAPVIATVFVLLAAIGGFLAWSFLSNRETCEHIAVNIAGKEATCTENGLTEGQQCELCGKILVQQNVIPATHTPGAEATCVAAQNCTVCNAELKAALGHTAGAEATCTTAQKCTVCQTELKAALGHTPANEWEILKEPSTTENGNKVKKCTLCGEKTDEELIPAIGNLNLSFSPFGNGTCYVSGIGNCTATEIVIPSTYNGMAVTAIGDSAFEHCTNLTSVVIPNTVTRINRAAFYGCSGLTSMVIPDSVTVIDEEAFYNCSSLTSVVIPDSVTNIGESAFYNCSSLTSVVIPDSVTNIGEYAFWSCYGLTSVTIGKGVTSIGSFAFDCCSGLTSIVIPDSVISIGDSAFSSSPNLTNVTIGNGVTSIGAFAFANCAKLRTVIIGSGVTSIGSRIFEFNDNLTSIYYNGTIEQWNAISRNYLGNIPATKVICSDGEVAI